MLEPDPRIWCAECGKVKMMTELGGILCPDGHGGVIDTISTGITRRDLLFAARDKERWLWLQQFPEAQRINRRGVELEGKAYVQVPFGGSSSVPWLEGPGGPPPPHRICQVDGEARYVKLAKS